MFLILKCFCWFLIFNISTGLSYNQPKLSSCASWNTTAVPFASSSVIGITIYEAFIDNDNIAYIIGYDNASIFVWPTNNSSPTGRIWSNITEPTSLFVDDQKNIYLSHSTDSFRIERWNSNTTANPELIWLLAGECWGLFMDRNQSLYCALRDRHQVLRKAINSTSTGSVVAGSRCAGSDSTMLTYPYGIFVDTSFNLYVADSGNNRIQLFSFNKTNGTTIAGTGAPNTIELNTPLDVTLDGNGYLFIVDSFNHRIVCSGPNGFRCIFGCLGVNAVKFQSLRYPHSISFDTSGNIFVADRSLHRVQKILLVSNHCETETTTYQSNTPIDNSTLATVSINTSTSFTSTATANVSYNLPKFGSCSTWNPNAVTIYNMSMESRIYQSIFIDRNNSVYTLNRQTGGIQIWSNGISSTLNFSNKYIASHALFFTNEGDVYIEDASYNGEIVKWSANGLSSETVAYVPKFCRGLFIDIANTIYCSIMHIDKVVKKSLNDKSTMTVTAAGNGCPGRTSISLNSPYGIFVDRQLRLFVADYNNHRIQLFLPGSLNGITVVGFNASYNITLNRPSSVVLDADNNIYVVDSGNHRIIYAGSDGTRCIVGCSRSNGSASDQLNIPHAMGFDSFGNIYVTDLVNERVQKFDLASNSCSTTESIITSTRMLSSSVLSSTMVNSNVIDSTMVSSTSWDSTMTNTQWTVVHVENNATGITQISMTSDFALSTLTSINNSSNQPCTILKPCLNHGICLNNNTSPFGYTCLCPSYFNGSNCQYDHRPCQANTCRNNGTCIPISSVDFICECATDWEGLNCEQKVDYCANQSCQNGGVCRQLIGDYRCECIDSSYSGRHCEVVSHSLLVKAGLCRSVGYIAVLFLVGVFTFVIVLDTLKYVFHVGSKENKLPHKQTKLQQMKRRRR